MNILIADPQKKRRGDSPPRGRAKQLSKGLSNGYNDSEADTDLGKVVNRLNEGLVKSIQCHMPSIVNLPLYLSCLLSSLYDTSMTPFTAAHILESEHCLQQNLELHLFTWQATSSCVWCSRAPSSRCESNCTPYTLYTVYPIPYTLYPIQCIPYTLVYDADSPSIPLLFVLYSIPLHTTPLFHNIYHTRTLLVGPAL